MAVQGKEWVCYLLKCADGTLYCGITNDLEKRIAVHNAGEGAKYTRGRTPVKLAYAEACEDKSAALKRERAIKRLPRAEKLELCRSSGAQAPRRRGGGAAGRRADEGTRKTVKYALCNAAEPTNDGNLWFRHHVHKRT